MKIVLRLSEAEKSEASGLIYSLHKTRALFFVPKLSRSRFRYARALAYCGACTHIYMFRHLRTYINTNIPIRSG